MSQIKIGGTLYVGYLFQLIYTVIAAWCGWRVLDNVQRGRSDAVILYLIVVIMTLILLYRSIKRWRGIAERRKSQ